MQDDVLEERSEAEDFAGEGVLPRLDLEVQINVVGACERHVRVTIPRDDIDRYFEEAVGKLSDEVSIPGFRRGRAPRKLVERRFRKEVQDQVKANLLNDSLQQLINEYDLAPISEPELDVERVLLPETGPLVYEFRLEVRPEFELPQWKGLHLDLPQHEVTDEQVDAQIQQLLLRLGRLVPTDEPARLGDYVTVNIAFRFGDRLLNEVREKELKLERRLVFRDGVLEGFDTLMAGVRPGERRTGQATVAADIADPALRGQQVAVEFEVLDVKRPELPELNEALLQRLGDFDSLAELREVIRDSLAARFEFQQRRYIREQVRQKLLAQADWDLPPRLLRRQAQRELERYALELRAAGYDEDAILARVNEVRQNILENTRRALQEHFLLERIAEDEGIEVSEADIEEEIAQIAQQQGESPRRVRARLEKTNQMDAVHNLAVERKVLDLIIANASFNKVAWRPAETAATPLDESVGGAAPPEAESVPENPPQQPQATPESKPQP